MIYCGGDNGVSLPIALESIYLEEELSPRMSDSNIFINPDNPTYIIRKTVIINVLDYPEEKIDILKKNKCNIISRVSTCSSDVVVSPYILRACFDINWNGKECIVSDVNLSNLFRNSIEEIEWSVEFPDYKLYFPKIYCSSDEWVNNLADKSNNLTCVGWVLHQVGVNIKKDTSLLNLDLIKTKKIDLYR